MKLNKGITILSLVIALGACRETFNDNGTYVRASDVGSQTTNVTNTNTALPTSNETQNVTNQVVEPAVVNNTTENTNCKFTVVNEGTVNTYVRDYLADDLNGVELNIYDFDTDGSYDFDNTETAELLNWLIDYRDFYYSLGSDEGVSYMESILRNLNIGRDYYCTIGDLYFSNPNDTAQNYIDYVTGKLNDNLSMDCSYGICSPNTYY